MIQAIIIDDEQHCIDRLDYLFSTFSRKTIQVTGAFQTVESGIQGIEDLKPDLVFLDIQIGGRTAFDLLDQFPEIRFEIIFTTAFDQYAIRAFKFSAVDYLLKPIDRDDLFSALDRVREKVSQSDRAMRFDVLFDHYRKTNIHSHRIAISTIDGFYFIQTDEIIRFQADINYTHFFLMDKQKLTVAKPLKEFEELLVDYQFYRVHNSHLVNLAFVKKYIKGKGGYLVMSDNSEIEVSTRRKEGFLKRLTEI